MTKISVVGRLQDRDQKTKAVSFYLDKDVIKWMEENVKGNKQLAFNYLMKQGIKSVEEGGQTVIVEDL
ncbi:MAG: hypothetical protein OQK09_14655 [Colwellia sp.]|nr:hypothetical protein [Colwellia sp.]MCW8863598.1 hypothetical protein [Colwellia sp.]MCW9082749.1 hypothetical protein [Colwellia sp.]